MKKITVLAISLLITGLLLLPSESVKAQSVISDLLPKANRGVKEIPQTVLGSKSAGAIYERRELFSPSADLIADGDALKEAVSEGVLLNLDKAAIRTILEDSPQYMTLPVPDGKGGIVELELFKVDIFARGFKVTTAAPTSENYEKGLGLHYRGMIKGEPISLAAVSIYEDEIMGSVRSKTLGNSVIGKLTGINPSDRHIFYDARKLKSSLGEFCNVRSLGSETVSLPAFQEQPEATTARVVRNYIEINFDVFQNKGSVAASVAFITGFFNQSATLYANDGIFMRLQETFVWNTASPYTATTSDGDLNLFKATRTNFTGDLAHLITLKDYGGIAYTDILCNRPFSYAVSGVNDTFQNVPTFSWTVEVFTHEAGHNLASPHTHACAWNGNNTAIDSCAPVEPAGGCASPGNPAGGGTIMSYCHLNQTGINFTLGFGPQPKALIQNRINAANCLTNLARPPFDFDGDGKSDISVFRPAGGAWFLNRSTAGFTGVAFGLGTDLLAPADFDGDGKTDVAVFRNGTWFYLRSTDNGFVGLQFGQAGDLPRPADFDGDGKADINVFRPSNGAWYRLNSTNGAFIGQIFGQNGDQPLIADFDGDGKSDIAVFRPTASAVFYWLESSTGTFKGSVFGFGTDIPAMGDFDGDAKTDISVFRPSNGAWYRFNSSNGAFIGNVFGQNGDIPVAGDYDGDGKTDIAVFRTGAWYVLQSSNGTFTGQIFGLAADKPVPAAFQ